MRGELNGVENSYTDTSRTRDTTVVRVSRERSMEQVYKTRVLLLVIGISGNRRVCSFYKRGSYEEHKKWTSTSSRTIIPCLNLSTPRGPRVDQLDGVL